MAKKRSAGEGSVRRTKSGSWRGELMTGYTDEGKKKIINFSGQTKSEVLEQIRAYQSAHIQINEGKAPSEIFEHWSNVWYADHKSQVQPSTYSGYRFTLKLLQKRFGKKPMTEILPIDINHFFDDLKAENYSMSQIHKCRTMLIQIFDAAEDNQLIQKNPARRSKKLRESISVANTDPAGKKDAFSEQEIAILENELPEDLLGDSIRIMLNTGLRVQELLVLEREDIAEDGSTIRVNKAVKMVDGIPTLGPTKSPASNRVVPVPMGCRAVAKRFREQGFSPYLWSIPGRHPIYGVGCFRRRYYTALSRTSGVRQLTPHCCRHTYATRLQEKGVPVETVARLMGHSDIAVTDGYLHISLDTLENAVNRLDKNTLKEKEEI